MILHGRMDKRLTGLSLSPRLQRGNAGQSGAWNVNEVFDWVIVGSGGGTMTSALLMARAGKSAAMLEKSK